MLPITIRTRTITCSDIELIQDTVNKHWDRGRTYISRVLCKKWNWVQPNGRLKDMACREVLLTLYRRGLVSVPPPKIIPKNKHKSSVPVIEGTGIGDVVTL